MASMGVGDIRLTGGEPLVRREFPRLVEMLAEIEDVAEVSVTTNGFLLERDAEALVRAGVDRFNVSIDSLQRDRFYELTRRDALPQVLRGLERLATLPRGAPDQDQRGRDPRVHRGGGAPVRRVRPPPSVRGQVHRVHAARRRPRLDPGPGADRRGDPRGDRRRVPARARAPRAERDGEGLPVRRRPRQDRVHQPGLRAVLRGLQPDPADRRRHGCGRACSRSTRPTCAGRCAPAPTTPSSSGSSATPSGARSSSTTSASPASSSRRGRCPRSAVNRVVITPSSIM